jgi:hypothetical protein
MEPEGLLRCSQEPSTGPYLEPDQSSPYHPILSLQDDDDDNSVQFFIIFVPSQQPQGQLQTQHSNYIKDNTTVT